MKRKEFETDQPVVVYSERKWYVVDINQLLFVEVKNKHCIFYFKNRQHPLKVCVSLRNVAACLPKNIFVKISVSCIVNIWEIVNFDKESVSVMYCGKIKHFSLTYRRFELKFFDIFEEKCNY